MSGPRGATKESGKAKVTVNVAAALVKRAKITAIKSGETLGELLERALRAQLRAR